MIWIRIVSKDGVPATSLALGVPLAAPFGDSVGDIGRGVGCTLVLPDPNREISRKQALVTCQAGRHFIRPIGTNLDIDLNGRPLKADAETPLDAGAELRIGPYRMRVERAPADSAAAPPSRAATPPARPPVAPVQPAPVARNAAQDPLAIFNSPNRPAKGGEFDERSKRQGAPGAPPGAAAGAAQQANAPPRAERDRLPPAPPEAGLPLSPDVDIAPPQPPVRPLPLPTPKDRVPAPARPAPGSKADRAAPAPPARSPAPPARVPPPGAPARAPAQPAAAAAANDAFVDALYGGLGMAPPAAGERSAERARLIGELLRESLAGTIELLAARQMTKKNLGASATMLQTRGNNPLKFSPHVDAALTHLLGAPLRGFIGPRDAVHDAFADLRAHQVAMLAGMRAALEAVLERFDPVALEARLAPKGVMDQLVPVNRRARLWETFGEQYASILREVEDDWDALFGRAFLQAYERQLAELARGAEE